MSTPLTDTAPVTLAERLSLGERLAKARKHAGMEQGQLAAKLDLSRVSVSNYETDKRVPSFPLVVKWAEETGVTLEYFVAALTVW